MKFDVYKVRYIHEGHDDVMYFSDCKDRKDAEQRADEARKKGVNIRSIRAVKSIES